MKTSFHIGDQVRIINPVFVDRVGYPLIWTMLEVEFGSNPKVQEAMFLLGLNPNNYREYKDFVTGVCMATVRHRHFGGKERTLHTHVQEELTGRLVYITSKRLVKTGIYNKESWGYTYFGEDDYQPAYLDPCKTHILLLTEYGEIESVNVKLVMKREQSVALAL